MPDLNHNDPGPEPGGGWNPPITYIVVIDYDSSLPRRVIFRKTYQVEAPTLPDNVQPVEPLLPTGGGEFLHHIPIAHNCYILIWLSRNVDWHWQKTRAITTATPLPAQYFKLQYLTPAGWASQPGTGETTRCVRFGALFRGPGPVTQEDLFNLNVELEYPGGEMLPITIDPDIQNPKV